jgi:peptidoglycan glycosyltransferase
VRSPNLDVLDKANLSRTAARSAPSVARDLTQMMIEVIDQGTGLAAQIPDQGGRQDGTAQSVGRPQPYAWFVSFAPPTTRRSPSPLIEDAGVERDAISGSGLAAPIAKRVMEAVINR